MIDVGKKDRVFRCDECPIVEQLGRRLDIAMESGRGASGLQFDHCSCIKTSDEFFMAGYCSDAWDEKPAKKKPGPRKHAGKAARRTRNKKEKRRARPRIRSNHGDGSKRKRRAARKVRRAKNLAMAGSGYKKIR